ncbi:alanine--tRNA ligase [Motilibacter deserti]|uniref:Alanine--tRNA ligase n=1 Tax=Motilibacter deserti TaxID=2714956 RepID=A0ABX0GSX1_9ACTN|nr:alanine--tRNA ligase [Motilibacter deserti]NHC13984.1 alanine--tRNA ligase [Motilibacter deserti]
MESAEIARRWLSFFEERGHRVVPSASLIADDPTLLLVNAGMVPFKPFFLGEQTPPSPRATSIQKCVRTLDIEEVGKTTRHASFFQMCGNFSFGDYFKEKAIPMAWELLTRSQADGGFGFPEDRLWVTVLHEDDESAELWAKEVGVPRERIQRRGPKDNYWHMGVPGPGGPCSEIYYDRGAEHGREGGPEADEERYLEVWNLVFMQYSLSQVRSKVDFDVAGELPAKNVDTGMGLERMATILQGVDNLYEIDTTWQVLDRAAGLAGKKYGSDTRTDVGLRVVADHARTAVMLIGDGVAPSNEGRGYVLRRMMRRTIRNMRLLGAPDVSMGELVDASIKAMAPQYPQLEQDRERITKTAVAEESSFLSTLRSGTQLFDLAAGQAKSAGAASLSGEEAFRLHDTYGFPIDLTLEMAEEQGLSVDADGFRRLMQEQRDRAKADARAKKTGHADVSAYRGVADAMGSAVTFTGYNEVVGEGTVRGLLRDGSAVSVASEGDVIEVVLDRTPFYAEGGGQLADAGYLQLANGAQIEVYDVQQPVPGVIVHRGKVMAGEAVLDLGAQAVVDIERRRAISRAHTATHMVHKAFREALGETATQAGSENAPGRFRFDFHAAGAVPQTVLRDVEQTVNELLAQDLPVHAEVMTQAEAVSSGAMALFGEKYGDEVRVVSVGDWARELCGGTHAQRSGQLGLVTLLGESSIGAGTRRVEALVGTDAYRFLAREHLLVNQLSDVLKARPEELPERIGGMVERLREVEKELQQVRSAQVLAAAGGLAASPADVFGVAVVTHHAPDGTSADDLRRLALDVRGRIPAERPAVVAVAAQAGERPVVVIAVNPAGREWRLKAGALVRVAAQVLGGGGGGKDDVAQGGGTDASKIDEALRQVEHTVGSTVTG